jgi:hypothetical protein
VPPPTDLDARARRARRILLPPDQVFDTEPVTPKPKPAAKPGAEKQQQDQEPAVRVTGGLRRP